MTINANPMAFNDWVTQIGLLVPVTTTIVDQVNTFTDPDLNTAIPQILNYAELRIQRDLSMLPAETSNTYTLTAGNYIFPLPVDDFVIVNRIVIEQLNGSQVISTTPLARGSPRNTSKTYTVDWRRAELLNSSRWSGTIGGTAERSTTTSHLVLPLLILHDSRARTDSYTIALYLFWRIGRKHEVHVYFNLLSRHAHHGKHDLCCWGIPKKYERHQRFTGRAIEL